MASVAAKESQTATQTVSITAVPTSSSDNKSGDKSTSLVQKVSTIEELHTLLDDRAKVILIEFFAEWCGPCKLMAKKLEDWAKIYDVTIAKVDVDELEELAIEYNVGGIPTFAFIKDKQKLEQLEGSQEDKIIAALEKHCKKSNIDVKHSSKPETTVSKIPVPTAKVNNVEEAEKRQQNQ